VKDTGKVVPFQTTGSLPPVYGKGLANKLAPFCYERADEDRTRDLRRDNHLGSLQDYSMPYFGYILQGKDGSHYIGHTSDLEGRLKRHNEGRSSYTRTKAPWKVVYREAFDSRSQAMKREKEIKRRKDHDYVVHLVRTSR